MRKVLLVLACIIFYSLCYSQADSITDATSKKIITDCGYNFSITLTNDSLSAGYFNDSLGIKYKFIKLPINNTYELDEYLKDNILGIGKKRLQYTIIHKVSLDSLLAVKNILIKYKIYHPAVMME